MTKLLFDDNPEAHGHGKILGGGMVGTHAGYMIGEVALAIGMGRRPPISGLALYIAWPGERSSRPSPSSGIADCRLAIDEGKGDRHRFSGIHPERRLMGGVCNRRPSATVSDMAVQDQAGDYDQFPMSVCRPKQGVGLWA